MFRDEAKDPERTIPQATYISLISTGVFYTVSSWVLTSANANPGTILQPTTQTYLGAAGGHVVQLVFVTSLFACILSFHSIASRYLFQLGARGVLPAHLGSAHPVPGAPSKAAVVLVSGAVLLRLDPIGQFYTWLGGTSSVGIVLLLALTSIAVLVYFGTKEPGGSRWQRRIAPGLGLLGLLAFLGIILLNLPELVGESVYGPFSVSVLVLLGSALLAGAVVAACRRAMVLH